MQLDGITLSVLDNYFHAAVEGMAHVLKRTAYTTFVKETDDFTTGLATVDGEFFAYPRDIGVSSFIGLRLSTAIGAISDYQPGDVIITNDPYSTDGMATHLPDIHMFKPIFADGALLCFAWCFIHCSDVGGAVAASISPSSYELFQEGIRLPPKRLYRAGELNRDILDVFLANCRIPEKNWGDFKAMIAALNTAERRIEAMTEKFGASTVGQGAKDLLDYAEQRARALIRDIPDGVYSFVDYLEDDLVSDVPVRIAVEVTVRDDTIHLDYSDTDPQVAAAFNIPTGGSRHPFLTVALNIYFFSTDRSMPVNGGILRPISITVPKGSLLNPEFPASCGVRYATVHRVYDTVVGALMQAVPGHVPTAGSGQGSMVVVSLLESGTGKRLVNVVEPTHGGGGGMDVKDGENGNDSSSGYLRNTPVESLEAEVPIIVRRYDLLPESIGHGRHRGGMGNRLDFQVFQPETIVTARGMERLRFHPWGVFGGRPGARGQAILNPGTPRERNIGKIDILRLEAGDILSIRTPGGGGYGDPLEREPKAVREDILNQVITTQAATEVYGVVLRDGDVDNAATQAQRAVLAVHQGPSIYAFGPNREEYERQWDAIASTALLHLLMNLSPSVRSYAKTLVHRQLADVEFVRLVDVEQAWAQLQSQIGIT